MPHLYAARQSMMSRPNPTYPERCSIPLKGSFFGRKIEMGFRRIPAGRFLMGQRGVYDASPVHEVDISRDFWLGETPVTQEQFTVWTDEEGIKHQNNFKDKPDHPAENMDWNEAAAFCEWLTTAKAKSFPKGFTLACLPTEAQWEYACRAKTTTEFWSGNGEGALAAVGWYDGNSKSSTQPVRHFAPNPWGLYDMHGNVFEWCGDAWDETAYAKRPHGDRDPQVEAKEGDENPLRVFRGGSWFDPAWFCRSATRGSGGLPPVGSGFGVVGFVWFPVRHKTRTHSKQKNRRHGRFPHGGRRDSPRRSRESSVAEVRLLGQ